MRSSVFFKNSSPKSRCSRYAASPSTRCVSLMVCGVDLTLLEMEDLQAFNTVPIESSCSAEDWTPMIEDGDVRPEVTVK